LHLARQNRYAQSQFLNSTTRLRVMLEGLSINTWSARTKGKRRLMAALSGMCMQIVRGCGAVEPAGRAGSRH
jgi:hypothetical protein